MLIMEREYVRLSITEKKVLDTSWKQFDKEAFRRN